MSNPSKLYALGIGVGTKNKKGDWLEVFYPHPVLHPTDALCEAIASFSDLTPEHQDHLELDSAQLESLSKAIEKTGNAAQAAVIEGLKSSERSPVICVLKEDQAPDSVPAGYLKLQLISHRLVKPHGTDITGIFGVLPNVAWTDEGAIDLAELTERQLAARSSGRTLSVDCIDKFPKMTDYVVPSGIRIADTSRVRLGAYVGEGTTVMHEGFINFNAGTEGPNMIEGRISAGVFVGTGTDFGGGCSSMGTLSGGGNIIISVGKECLLGANSGIGIGLGDRCTVEAGLYITAGTKVQIISENKEVTGTVKAADLSGKSDLLFRRNSSTGAVECLTNKSVIELNSELHAHN